MSTNIMMDGVSTMDTGSNAAMRADEHGVDCRSQAARVGLPGRIRAVERPADHGGHQERHEPVPRLVLQRAAQFRLERQQQDEHPQRRAEDRSRSSRTSGYSIGGPIGKPGGNNKLFFFHALEFRPRTGGNDQQTFRVPDRAGARRATSRRRSTTSAISYPYIKDPNCRPASAPRRARRPASPTAACSAGSRRIVSTSPGLNILKMWPMPNNPSTTIGHELRSSSRPAEDTLGVPAGGPLRLSAARRPCGSASSTRAQSTGSRSFSGTHPRVERLEDRADSAHRHGSASRSTTTSARRRSSRRTYGRAGNQLAGCGAAS